MRVTSLIVSGLLLMYTPLGSLFHHLTPYGEIGQRLGVQEWVSCGILTYEGLVVPNIVK